jgi:beta-lactamase class A
MLPRLLLLTALATSLLAQTSPIDRLKSSIQSLSTSLNATWGVYIKCLETGEEVAINADRQMDTMSVIKIPLMVEVFHQIKEGKLALDTRYTLTKEDMRPGTGILRSLDVGDTITLKDLILLMNIVSDNTLRTCFTARSAVLPP